MGLGLGRTKRDSKIQREWSKCAPCAAIFGAGDSKIQREWSSRAANFAAHGARLLHSRSFLESRMVRLGPSPNPPPDHPRPSPSPPPPHPTANVVSTFGVEVIGICEKPLGNVNHFCFKNMFGHARCMQMPHRCVRVLISSCLQKTTRTANDMLRLCFLNDHRVEHDPASPKMLRLGTLALPDEGGYAWEP